MSWKSKKSQKAEVELSVDADGVLIVTYPTLAPAEVNGFYSLTPSPSEEDVHPLTWPVNEGN